MEIRELIYFTILVLVGIIVILRDRKKTQRVLELDRKYIKVLDDLYAFEKELREKGLSDEELQALRDKFRPEEEDFSSEFTDWKKALFSK